MIFKGLFISRLDAIHPLVVLLGLEPSQAEPKTAVLPLHHRTIRKASDPSPGDWELVVGTGDEPRSRCKVTTFFLICKILILFHYYLLQKEALRV